MEPTEYGRIAPYYDLVYEDVHDIAMYKRLAREFGEPILEIACGTGRVMLELAKLGYEVGGVDNNNDMLDILRKKLEKMPADMKHHIKIKQADMRNFNMERRYRLAIIPFTSFFHLSSTKDRESCLRAAFEHVINGGRVVVDVFNPDENREQGTVRHEATKTDKRGMVISKFSTSKMNKTAKAINCHHFIDVTDKTGNMNRVTINF
ncbi:MAG: class I SAM-dependent methyltransferase, partial [Candidatus Aenigmarchaeota archaeon]